MNDKLNISDMIGQKFGFLTVIGEQIMNGGHTEISCQCDCGNSYVVKASYLIRGSVKSCGCLQKDITTKGTRANKWAYDNKRIFEERCAKCGSKSNLQSHHILPRNKYPELSQNYANGITLCYDCHKEFHHKYGFNCNIQDMADFLGLGEYEVKIIDLIIHHRNKNGAEDIRKIKDFCDIILELDYGIKRTIEDDIRDLEVRLKKEGLTQRQIDDILKK